MVERCRLFKGLSLRTSGHRRTSLKIRHFVGSHIFTQQSSYPDLIHGAQTTWDPFSSSCTPLRQTQSLASLPTSRIGKNQSYTEPLRNVRPNVGSQVENTKNAINIHDQYVFLQHIFSLPHPCVALGYSGLFEQLIIMSCRPD